MNDPNNNVNQVSVQNMILMNMHRRQISVNLKGFTSDASWKERLETRQKTRYKCGKLKKIPIR